MLVDMATQVLPAEALKNPWRRWWCVALPATELRTTPDDGGKRAQPRPEKTVESEEPKHQEMKQRGDGAKDSCQARV